MSKWVTMKQPKPMPTQFRVRTVGRASGLGVQRPQKMLKDRMAGEEEAAEAMLKGIGRRVGACSKKVCALS